MITIPIFDYKCKACQHIWENVEVWPSHKPTKCPKCGSEEFEKVFTTIVHEIRMDANTMKHELPDPVPPLTELSPRKDSESGLSDLPRTELKNYTRKRDKHGNAIWEEKRRTYFGAGGPCRSSEEKT